jgi:Asp-tRNA(Asn)/Glu-tRNA(Gln) amidotransferase A subunit family amidase
MLNATLKQLSAYWREKDSSVELTQFLRRVRRFNPQLNAFITVDEPGVKLEARNADLSAKGEGALTAFRSRKGPFWHGAAITCFADVAHSLRCTPM